MRQKIILQLVFFLSVVFMFSYVWAGSVTLAWDPNTEADLAGYKLYYGHGSRLEGGIYTDCVEINKNTTTITVTLEPSTYYFALTAFNTASKESGYSNEVSSVVEEEILPLPSKPGKPLLLP